MCPESDRPSEDAPKPIGQPIRFGWLSYDPLNKTYWYYGFGVTVDQGGVYSGPMNFGTKSIEDLCNILKYQVTQIAEDLHNRAMEKVDGKTET